MESSSVLFRPKVRLALALILVGLLLVSNGQAATIGDVNGDGKVDVFDALLTLQYAVNLIPHDTANNTNYLATADVSPLDANLIPKGDGKVDVFDALVILQRAVNLLTWTAPSNYAQTDLSGTWNLSQLTWGADNKWTRGTATVTNSGMVTFTSKLDSTGDITLPSTKAFSLSSSGIVTSATIESYNGVLSNDRNTLVATSTGGPGIFKFDIWTRSGGTFAPGDAQGTWKLHSITPGSPRWTRADVEIDASGNMTVTNNQTNTGSDSGSFSPMSVGPSGVITFVPASSASGYMTADKNTIIITNGSGSVTKLTIMSRVTDVTYSGSDIQGSWRTNLLSANNGASGIALWGRAIFSSDVNGNATFNETVLSGGTQPDKLITTSLSSAGNITISGTDFSGYMSSDKRFMVGVSTESLDGNLNMFVFMKEYFYRANLAMFSGKSFITSDGVITFSTDGTMSGVGLQGNETWTINSSGQLVIYNTGRGTATYSFVSGDAMNGWTEHTTYSNGTSSTGTLVPATLSTTIVIDPTTNLVWQQSDDNTKRNWNDALLYCNNLTLNGYNNWRLPSAVELKGLNSSSVFNQLSGTYFTQVDGQFIGSYWSSTSFDNSQAYHVFLKSDSTSEGYANKSFYYNLVRCARP